TNGLVDVFVRDLLTGSTEIVSVGMGGAQSNGESRYASISGDGRYVSFYSEATNLVPGDTNGADDVFVRDLVTGVTKRVSVDGAGRPADGDSALTSISADGSRVAFWSSATNLVPGDTNGMPDLFVRDLRARTTTRVNVDSSGAQSQRESFSTPMTI